MKLFQIKASPLGVERIAEFLENNYICIGYPGTGDLEGASPEEMLARLLKSGAYQGKELEAAVVNLNLFVHEMQDGDYVLVADGQWVHLGDLGDYFYDETYDKAGDGRCHRRGVTWLKSIPQSALNPEVAELLADESSVSRYRGTLPAARIELWLEGTGPADSAADGNRSRVDEITVAKAIAVLKEALNSDDADRRERAAVAILHYAK
ncbi:hypothetical protein [Paenibacillus sp. FSL R7-0273]|uniref:hypothetical protein n=1 Tax=Paenibacillus sp. FSL R7-0273 TaxID=1536772 RepID=UPI0006939556|nr:hypothetical protein [Paenibacillus sp. FSL R7-0273]OMF97533.1 hypothetical protein BK144_02505 [Paenibacillus sp. FSL R7-0273]